MKIIENIKYNYYIKVFEEDLKNLNFDSLKANLQKLAKAPHLYSKIHQNFFKEFNDITNSHNIFPCNYIFINSFLEEDLSLIKNFLKYYFEKTNYQKFSEIKYEELIDQINLLLKDYPSPMAFEDVVSSSMIYQSLFGFLNEEKELYIENIHSFFSTQHNYNFTDAFLTKCYFLIVDEPLQVYQDIKKRHNLDKDLAQNIMFNLDNKPLMDEKLNIEVTRKSWPIHTSSWTDPNVMNALKGLVLNKRLLLQKDLETYASIILHLKQANIKINLQYDLIQQYLDENNFINQSNILDLSNNEKKFIEKNIQGYQLNLPE
jgi:hypothetical protein